ncbi:MAG: D-aminoacylase, partial [Chloroflexota bacterium]|nr:D-aminoacylase [Chloroflexota bacterium]
MKDRGTLKEKNVADIVIFDPENIADVSTYQHPHQYPVGIAHVLVKGEPIIKDGTHTGARPGRVLRRGE